jgi:hypothetical protein
MGTSPVDPANFFRNVRHVCDGGCRWRPMYFPTNVVTSRDA